MTTSRKKGFTLVEIMVVVAIIAILAAALVPKIMAHQREAKFTAVVTDWSSLDTTARGVSILNDALPTLTELQSKAKDFSFAAPAANTKIPNPGWDIDGDGIIEVDNNGTTAGGDNETIAADLNGNGVLDPGEENVTTLDAILKSGLNQLGPNSYFVARPSSNTLVISLAKSSGDGTTITSGNVLATMVFTYNSTTGKFTSTLTDVQGGSVLKK